MSYSLYTLKEERNLNKNGLKCYVSFYNCVSNMGMKLSMYGYCEMHECVFGNDLKPIMV